MSYFDVPRLHLSGRFFADPSTVNNDPTHYLPETTRPSPWQMPRGQHFFRFHDCRVMSAQGPDGPSRDAAIVGAKLRTTDEPRPAKIVDLDVYQQGVSTLYGVEILIENSAGGSLKGMLDPAVLNGCSFNFVQPTRGWHEEYGSGSYGGDSNAIGVFQSVIRVNEADWTFPDDGLMGALRQRCMVDTSGGVRQILLAFKFLLDGYWNVPGSIDYQHGRMTGAIGPLRPGDPHETPGARWLQARDLEPPKEASWYWPFFYRAPFRVDAERSVLQVDWMGSVSRQTVGGDPCDLGEVTAVVAGPDGPVTLGTLAIDAVAYMNDAAISEIALTREQVELLSSNPLEIRTSRDDIGPRRILYEASDGIACCTQHRSIRMTPEPGSPLNKVVATAHVTEFGRPKAGVRPKLKILPVHGDTPGATVPPTNPGDTPQADGALAAIAGETDSEGFAQITFKVVKDPGSRTPELDGQLYFAYAYLGEDPSKEPRQESQISVLAWSQYEVKNQPEWEDIRKMMAPYAKLYPGMSDKFNLADEEAFVFYSNNPGWSFFIGPHGKHTIPTNPDIQNGAIPYYLSLPIEDPRYMPITRDLSPNKVLTIFNFIENEQKRLQDELAAGEGGQSSSGPQSGDDPWLATRGDSA